MLKSIHILLIGFGLTLAMPTRAEFSLAQIPPLSNQTPITLVAEKGFWTDYLTQEMLPKFTEKTGVKVKVVSTDLGTMFDLQTQALQLGEGRYDLLSMEAGWAKEWAANGYTAPLVELAKLYDPDGEKAMESYLEPYYPSLLNILSYHGEIHAIPYNNYVMGSHYRADLFENKTEQINFQQRFGYQLAPAKNLGELQDQAVFFTRKAGTQLADKVLAQDFYGLALMSGNKPHINDEFSSIIWSLGGAWMWPKYNQQKQLTHFEIPTINHEAIKATDIYRQLMPYALPADDQFAFNEAANALATGRVAIWPFAYNNLWSASFQVEKNIPGARLGVAQVPGGHPYNGAYAFAVSYDSKNPQAAYWLLKYMGTFEAQRAYALGGGNPCRMDVVTAPEFKQDSLREVAGAFEVSHAANLFWSTKVLELGHFTSTAMGQIYPELSHACYAASHKQTDSTNIFIELSARIKNLQNTYGEVPAIDKNNAK
ncbi:MAG: sugar ABC transporter substrate-binding protein [Shewanella sp. CG12_big_fil_rev_8_21_14_0_65_47_15]|nr:MAG: sugar ABC transporter substrate-binding protein [Shewanella sp. CG12_big_fil_rev_8_21_14_0_65_47_15]